MKFMIQKTNQQRLFVTTWTTRLTNRYNVFMCCIWSSSQPPTIFLCSINRLVFLIFTDCVLYAVRIEYLHIMWINFSVHKINGATVYLLSLMYKEPSSLQYQAFSGTAWNQSHICLNICLKHSNVLTTACVSVAVNIRSSCLSHYLFSAKPLYTCRAGHKYNLLHWYNAYDSLQEVLSQFLLSFYTFDSRTLLTLGEILPQKEL
jgi:hypothetical protein